MHQSLLTWNYIVVLQDTRRYFNFSVCLLSLAPMSQHVLKFRESPKIFLEARILLCVWVQYSANICYVDFFNTLCYFPYFLFSFYLDVIPIGERELIKAPIISVRGSIWDFSCTSVLFLHCLHFKTCLDIWGRDVKSRNVILVDISFGEYIASFAICQF